MIHIRSCSHYHFKSWNTLNKLVYKQIYQQRYTVYWRVLQRNVLYSIFIGLQCTVHTVYCTVQYLQCTAVYRIYGVLQCKVHRSVQNIQCTAVYSLYRYYALSQRFFPKRQLSKGIFPSGNFPNVHFFKQQPPKSVLAATLDLPGRS